MSTLAAVTATRTYDTPDGQVAVIVDDDHAWIDGAHDEHGLTADQLAATIAAAEQALADLSNATTSHDRLTRHIDTRARHVADTHSRATIRARCRHADVTGRDDLSVDIWRRAAALRDSIDHHHTRAVAAALGDDDMAGLLALVDDGRVTVHGAWAGHDRWLGIRGVDGQQDTPAGVDKVTALDDLRHDGLVEPHLLVTTAHGWAVRRALVAMGLGGAA